MHQSVKIALLWVSTALLLGSGATFVLQKRSKNDLILAPTLISKAQVAPAGAVASNPLASATKSSSAVAGAKVTAPQPAVPSCSPATTARPIPLTVTTDSAGLHESSSQLKLYPVYGTTVDQIATQLYTCSPISEGATHFAASTDYVITWAFNLRVDASGLCHANAVSVGLNIAQTYPDWQSTTATTNGVANSWQGFITNLTGHENGHTALDRQYASQLVEHLQSTPAGDCSTMNDRLTAMAQADIAALNQANNAYDSTTNHGATQGAILQ